MFDRVAQTQSFELVPSGFGDNIAGKDSGFFCRRTRKNLFYDHSELAFVDHGAYSFEIAGNGFVKFFRFVEIEIFAMPVP